MTELVWDGKCDTRKSIELQLTTTRTYDAPGASTAVKVIDILGNDTTKTLKVEVKG